MISIIKATMTATAVSLIVSSAFAASVNSVCTMNVDKKMGVVDGDKNVDKKFDLASISKVVTTLWAIEKLGPEYRYTTKLHVRKNSANSYDVHIQGSRDPIFGRNASYYLISELTRKGIDIKEIDNLTFDENFLLAWKLEDRQKQGGILDGDTPRYKTMQEQTDAIARSLRGNFATPISASSYKEVLREAKDQGIEMSATTPKIKVHNVQFKSLKDFRKSDYSSTLLYRSTPLKRILKNMNNKSNNYIADYLFWNLGGIPEFNKFISESLALTEKDMKFYIGSGNNVDYLEEFGDKSLYNQATCSAMIRVIYKLDKALENHGLQLSDVMAVPGRDSTSTLNSYTEMSGAGAAKTGSVFTAKTLAGSVLTAQGEIYFVILIGINGGGEYGIGTQKVKEQLREIIKKNGGTKQIKYNEFLPLPFDKGSRLINEMSLSGTKG